MSSGPKPAVRAWLLLGLLGFLLLQMLLNPSRVWHYLFVSLAVALGASYLWVLSLSRGLRVGRRLRSSLVQVGDRVAEDFALSNASFLPAPWVEIRDLSDLPGYSVGVALSAGPQSEERWRAGGICRQRGQFSIGPWSVHTGDPFGFFEASGEGGPVADLLVYPPVGSVPEITLSRGHASGSRSRMRRSLEQTVSSAGVRQYVAGDPPRYIHWPTSARSRELMVKDFDLEPAGNLWIVMGMCEQAQAADEEESTEESMVLAAAALGARALRRSQDVGVLAYGERRLYLPPGRGDSQFWRLMRELATVRAQGAWSIGRVLQAERWSLGHAASVVILASSAEPDLTVGIETVRRLGATPSVFLFDAASFGGGGDTAAVARQLLDLSVPHWVIDREHEYVPLSRKERMRRRLHRPGERWGLRSYTGAL